MTNSSVSLEVDAEYNIRWGLCVLKKYVLCCVTYLLFSVGTSGYSKLFRTLFGDLVSDLQSTDVKISVPSCGFFTGTFTLSAFVVSVIKTSDRESGFVPATVFSPSLTSRSPTSSLIFTSWEFLLCIGFGASINISELSLSLLTPALLCCPARISFSFSDGFFGVSVAAAV